MITTRKNVDSFDVIMRNHQMKAYLVKFDDAMQASDKNDTITSRKMFFKNNVFE